MGKRREKEVGTKNKSCGECPKQQLDFIVGDNRGNRAGMVIDGWMVGSQKFEWIMGGDFGDGWDSRGFQQYHVLPAGFGVAGFD